MWAIFVRETAAVVIEGHHPRFADEFGQGARVSQAFRMVGNGLTAFDVRFSTDRLLTLLIRCELAQIAIPESREEPREAVVHTWFVTIKRVSGVEWRRITFPPEEHSHARVYVVRLQLINAAPVEDGTAAQVRHEPPPDRRPRVALVVSKDNVLGGGTLWIADRRQVGSLSLRVLTHARTAYEQFRAVVTPALPSALRSMGLVVIVAIVYQGALLTVVYALLIGGFTSSTRRASSAGAGVVTITQVHSRTPTANNPSKTGTS